MDLSSAIVHHFQFFYVVFYVDRYYVWIIVIFPRLSFHTHGPPWVDQQSEAIFLLWARRAGKTGSHGRRTDHQHTFVTVLRPETHTKLHNYEQIAIQRGLRTGFALFHSDFDGISVVNTVQIEEKFCVRSFATISHSRLVLCCVQRVETTTLAKAVYISTQPYIHRTYSLDFSAETGFSSNSRQPLRNERCKCLHQHRRSEYWMRQINPQLAPLISKSHCGSFCVVWYGCYCI